MSSPTYYFGYGSNLWLKQMTLRCPSATYAGIARLARYRWIINGRGYANIVQTSNPTDVVYGLVYALTEEDEKRLDVNEGVPWAYTKEYMAVGFWPLKRGEKVDIASGSSEGGEGKVLLVYIDRKRVEDDVPNAEYVHRINMGLRDAVKIGLPLAYVDDVIRKFIPAEGEEEEEAKVMAIAGRQALVFEDER